MAYLGRFLWLLLLSDQGLVNVRNYTTASDSCSNQCVQFFVTPGIICNFSFNEKTGTVRMKLLVLVWWSHHTVSWNSISSWIPRISAFQSKHWIGHHSIKDHIIVTYNLGYLIFKLKLYVQTNLMASCKCLGVILFTFRSLEAFPANSSTSAVRYSKIAAL